PALHLTRVQAGPDLDAEVGYGIADRTCATDGPRRAVEGGEEAVPSRVDLQAAEPLEEPPDVRVMVLQQVTPPAVAELSGPVRGADDVGEQDRGQAPVGYRGPARPGEELLDLIKGRVGVPQVRQGFRAGQQNVPGVRDLGGGEPPRFLVVVGDGALQHQRGNLDRGQDRRRVEGA